MSKLTISYLFFAISFTFSQTEIEKLIIQAEEFAEKKNYKAAIEFLKSAYQEDDGNLDKFYYFNTLGFFYLSDNQ